MSFYKDHIYPYLVDRLGDPLPIRKIRQRLIPVAQGKVLEIGTGSGANFPLYSPARVSKLYALEPNPGMIRLAERQRNRTKLNIEFLGLPGERIPLENETIDTVVSTFTLCTIPDITEALTGIARVLKPNGTLIFFELGHSPDPGVQRWQKRLEPICLWLFQGLHLTRNIPPVIVQSGFQISQIEADYLAKFPKPLSYCWWGAAKKRGVEMDIKTDVVILPKDTGTGLSDPLRGERRISDTTSETLRSAQSDNLSPYPDINEVLHLLLSNVREILGEQLIGMYLYGSLSGGDFNPESSDIDFLVVTTDILSEERISELEAMHNRIWATGLKWASKLEGAYVSQNLIRRHDTTGAPCPTVNEGRFFVAGIGSDWIIQRHIVREQGVALAGPDPKTLIDPITADDIRGAVLGILREWWFPMLADASWLRDHGCEYHAFTVITMCRVLHALEHGTIVSKPKAVEWARMNLGNPWMELIDKALAASRHENQEDLLDETLDFIRFTKEQIGNSDP